VNVQCVLVFLPDSKINILLLYLWIINSLVQGVFNFARGGMRLLPVVEKQATK